MFGKQMCSNKEASKLRVCTSWSFFCLPFYEDTPWLFVVSASLLLFFLLSQLASSTNTLLRFIRELSRLQSSILSTDGVRYDSPCSMTSIHFAIAVPKLIWNDFHAPVEWKWTSLDFECHWEMWHYLQIV